MQILIFLSNAIIPVMVFGIVGSALLNRKPVYELFVRGAKEGLKTVAQIAPTMIGLMAAVGILRSSGLLDALSGWLGSALEHTRFPALLVPLTVVRLFSSSAATGLALDIFKEYGPDSRIGMTASIMMSCTETVFYTMSVYFMAAGIKKTRHTLAGALLASFAGIAVSTVLAGKLV